MSGRAFVTRARVEGLAILALAAGYLWKAQDIPSLFETPGVPGPAAFPKLIGLILAASGILRLIVSPRDESAAQRESSESPKGGARDEGAPPAAPFWQKTSWRLGAMWAVLLLYLLLMPVAGFPAATGLALAALFWLLGEQRWWRAAGLAVASTALMHAGFAWGLGVKLPLGILESLQR